MDDWLRRLRHDLVKPATWVARDFAAGVSPTESDRALLLAGLTRLCDDEGAPVSAQALWQTFRGNAPDGIPAAALDAFAAVLADAEVAANTTTLPVTDVARRLLAVENAFLELVRHLN